MREIKFRGKRIDTGKWVYGYYFKTPLSVESAKGAEISDGLHFLSGQTRHCISAEDGCVYEVNPGTIGQFTDLHYKNGEEIYEGDIVEFNRNGKTIRGKVIFDKVFGQYKIDIYDGFFGTYDRYMVIGNIHDNPELLA